MILSETERLDTLVMEMVDLSRLEAGRVKLSKDLCNLNMMINQKNRTSNKKKILLNGSILSLIYIFFSLLLIIIIPSLVFSIKLFINYLLILLICTIIS